MQINELIIFLCIVLPMIPVIFAMRDKYSKRFMIFMIIGFSICLFSAQVNTLLINQINMDDLNFSITFSPINEEILKAIPIIFFALVFAKEGEEIIPLAFAVGIGFGILENVIIYCNNIYASTIGWALIRGIGASLMHSACVAMTAIGISYVLNKKRMFFQGMIGLFSLAILFHATFNAFVQSNYSIIALIMPILLFIPINYIEYRRKEYLDNLKKEHIE